jgi:hypothetical protein
MMNRAFGWSKVRAGVPQGHCVDRSPAMQKRKEVDWVARNMHKAKETAAPGMNAVCSRVVPAVQIRTAAGQVRTGLK